MHQAHAIWSISLSLVAMATEYKRSYLDGIKGYNYYYTVKILINARAFIRLITFLCDGGGRLLEAIIFGRTYVHKVQILVNVATMVLLGKGNVN